MSRQAVAALRICSFSACSSEAPSACTDIGIENFPINRQGAIYPEMETMLCGLDRPSSGWAVHSIIASLIKSRFADPLKR